jgi:hypothetical protein
MTVALALAQLGAAEQAVATAERIENDVWIVDVLLEVAATLRGRGDSDASGLALTAAGTRMDQVAREGLSAQRLADLALDFADLGLIERAGSIADEAWAAVRSEPGTDVEVLVSLTRALVRSGRQRGAVQMALDACGGRRWSEAAAVAVHVEPTVADVLMDLSGHAAGEEAAAVR